MVQIGAREVAAGVAAAGLVQRRLVFLVLGVLDLDVAKTGEQPAIAGVTRRHDAVEHVDAVRHARHQVFRRAHAHQVMRLVGRQARTHVGQHAHHVFLRLADGQAADGDAGEIDLFQLGQRFVAQHFEHAALHDAEQRIRVLAAVELVLRALRPAQGHAHGLGRFLDGGRAAGDFVRRAFVELHDDVGIQDALHLHRHFRREEQFIAVDGRIEMHALFRDLAHGAQRKHLEAARIRQNRLVPAHETMQAAEFLHDGVAWTQPQVESVAQNDLRVDLIEFQRRHGFHGAVSAHWHEDRRLHDAMVEFQGAAACLGQAARVGLE